VYLDDNRSFATKLGARIDRCPSLYLAAPLSSRNRVFLEASIRADIGVPMWNDGAPSTTDREATNMNEVIHRPESTILRINRVKARTGLARSTIYERIKEGDFPAQVSLGPRAVGWLESDIEAWIARKVERSRQG
jgi:prophage regulatory protein